jgi:hypothetical protein
VVILPTHTCIKWLTHWKSILCFEALSIKRLSTCGLFTQTWVPLNSKKKKSAFYSYFFFPVDETSLSISRILRLPYFFSQNLCWEGRADRSQHRVLLHVINRQLHITFRAFWVFFPNLPSTYCFILRHNELRRWGGFNTPK